MPLDIEHRKEYQREYARRYRQERYPEVRAVQNSNWFRTRARAVEVLGGACVHCGNADIRVLDIDHVDGSGHVDRKKRNKTAILRAVANGEPGYQLLCANCHRIKTYENREHLRR